MRLAQTPILGPVLVTGGNGFLGRAITKALQARGETVIIFDRAAPKTCVQDMRVRHEIGDIRNAADLSRAIIGHNVRSIVHLAAVVIPTCRLDPSLGAEVNILGHINVFEAARTHGITRLVYTSSLAARPRGKLNAPANLYGAYKRCCEDISKVYFMDHGIASVGLRPNIVYGPGREEGETAAITAAMRAAAEGRAYVMPFAGKMCFQHVDEVVDIMLQCLSVEAREPVVSDLTIEVRSTDDLISAIRQVVPDAQISVDGPVRPSPETMDNSPLVSLLGSWEPVGLEEGTRRTIAAFNGAA